MPKYRITGPFGEVYEVTAPEGASEQDIVSFVQKNAVQSDFAQRAAAMTPQQKSEVRSRAESEPFGDYLRAQAALPRPGESEDERFKRLYGGISGSDVGAGEGVARAVLQGGTFGGGDEIVAAGAAALNRLTGKDPDRSFNELYDAYLGRERGNLRQFRKDSPVAAYGAEIAGAIPTGMALPGFGAGATGASNALRGAASAGMQGGIYGFLSGENDVVDRGVNAALSAGIAMPIGAAAPVAAKGVGSLAQRLMTSRAAAPLGLSRPSYDVLSRAMDADGSLSGSGAANIKRAGPGAMVADAGPNARMLLDTTMQRSGPASTVAREAIEARAGDANRAITGALDDAFGVPTVQRRGAGAAAPAIDDAYKAAYATPIDYASDLGRRIEGLVRSRVPPSAIRAANDLMRVDGHQSAQILASIADDGSVSFQRMPDVRQLDYITRGLNEVASQADGQGKLGGTTQLGRAYGNLSREIRTALKEMVPEYKAALDLSGGAIRERTARDFGGELLSARVTRADVADMLSDMGAAEKTKVGEGVRQYIDDTVANVKRALTDSNMDAREAIRAVRDLSSRAGREKLETLLGPQEAARLFDRIDEATMALDLRAGLAGNSKTFARTSMDEVIRAQTEDGVINAIRSGRPVNAGQRLAQTLMGRTPAARERVSDRVYSEIAQFLTGPRGPAAEMAIQDLQQAQQRIGAGTARAGSLAEMLLRRNAAVTAPAYENLRR